MPECIYYTICFHGSSTYIATDNPLPTELHKSSSKVYTCISKFKYKVSNDIFHSRNVSLLYKAPIHNKCLLL